MDDKLVRCFVKQKKYIELIAYTEAYIKALDDELEMNTVKENAV